MHSCRQLSKWLGDNGFEISHAAIHKYGQKFERRLDAIQMATEQARIVCEQFKGDDEQMQSALMRMVQTRLFEVLVAANEKNDGRREWRGDDDRAGEYHGAGAQRVGTGEGRNGASEVGRQGARGSSGGGEEDRRGAGEGPEQERGGADQGSAAGDLGELIEDF